jgi:ATP-dependent HslUV protease ATP-binding subunit HslU
MLSAKRSAAHRELTPREIVNELDRYIISQKAAKKAVAIAIRNRWRRMQTPDNLREEIMPNNIIMIGPTGVGKTEIARRLARLVNAPFLKVEASKFTEVGYVGRDVESIVRDLTEFSVNMLKAEQAALVQDRAERQAEERILDILVPAVKRRHAVEAGGESAEAVVEVEDNKATRDKFREKLRGGELEDRIVEIEVAAPNLPAMQVFGPVNVEEMGVNLQEVFSNILPKRMKKTKMNVAQARGILIQEEAQKLVDTETVVKEAVRRVEESGIVFIDEIDKIAGEKSHAGPDVSREGVQRDILPIVEGTTVLTKYGMVNTEHILFIASGAFHVSKPADLIPELQGRFPIRVELESLSEEDFVRILTLPQNALIKQYTALLETEKVHLEFSPEGIREIARVATLVNAEVENIGARRLHTIMTTLLEEVMFDAPDQFSGKTISVTREMVDDKLSGIVRNKDLSRYVL